MGAAKASNSKDTYLATAVTFIVIGALYLIDKLIHFSSLGLPWVMNKDNLFIYHPRQTYRSKGEQFIYQEKSSDDNKSDGSSLISIFIIICFDSSHRYFPPNLLM